MGNANAEPLKGFGQHVSKGDILVYGYYPQPGYLLFDVYPT